MIQIPPTFLTSTKGKHLLLDTNLFRDAAMKPTVYDSFFNELKSSEITLTTIDLVKYELLKGSSNSDKYKAKEKLISDIVDTTIPILPETHLKVYNRFQEHPGFSIQGCHAPCGAWLVQYRMVLGIEPDMSSSLEDAPHYQCGEDVMN